MTQYITRAYNSFTFDYRNSTIKKYSKEERLFGETQFYKNIPPQLSIYFPRLVDSGFNEGKKEYFLELELYPYENLGKLLIENKLSKEQWTEIAEHLADILAEFGKITVGNPLLEDMRAMYIEKTEREYKNLVAGFMPFKKLSEEKVLTVNGVEYLNFEQVWPKILEKYSAKLLDENIKPSVIHGDFCFSNILAGFLPNKKTILRFIDPRGKFGKMLIYGDPYYDLMKLMHSTDVGYEYFIYDQFEVKGEGNKFTLKYANDYKTAVHNIFNEHLYSKYDALRIKLIEATVYIGMCARHYDSETRQLAMYLSGVRLLNEILNV